MKQSTKRLVIGFASATFATLACAQDFPNRPLRIILAYAPGSSADILPRAVAHAMSLNLGQPVVIDNRPGAGGVTAMQELIKSPPDGYTLINIDPSQWAVFPAQRPGVYDPQKDMTPVSLIYTGSLFVLVQDSFPAKNLQQFVAVVKANPGKFSYGSSGIGTAHHLSMESFKAALGVDIVHVPYKGSNQSSVALLGDQISMMVGGLSYVKGALKGRLRLIAATTAQRSRFAPDVASLAEALPGVTDFDFRADQGLFAPAGTPKAIIDKLAAAVQRALQNPDVVQRIEAAGLEPLSSTPEQLADLVRADIVRYAKAVKISGARLD